MTPAHPEPVAVTRSNPGETLCKARENRGLSLSDAAAQLNLSISALSSLEAGAFERLPGHTFARGYIRAYAKLLDLDPNRLVLEFDQFSGTDAAGSTVHSIAKVDASAKLSHSFLRFLSFAVLALIFVVAVLWWQDQNALREAPNAALTLEHVEVEGADGTTQIHSLDEPEDQVQEVLADELLLPVTPVADEAASLILPAAVSGTESTQAVTDAAAAVPTEPVAAVQAVIEVSEQPAATVAAGEGLVAINFTATCWMQLTDADGKVLLSTLKRAGEAVSLTGKKPLELRLGYVPGAQVSFNGQPIDLAPFTSGETARLKLGQ